MPALHSDRGSLSTEYSFTENGEKDKDFDLRVLSLNIRFQGNNMGMW
jgi:hypothetical protein